MLCALCVLQALPPQPHLNSEARAVSEVASLVPSWSGIALFIAPDWRAYDRCAHVSNHHAVQPIVLVLGAVTGQTIVRIC